MPLPISAEQLSQALFQADPMNTGCKENDCYDEYDLIAQAAMSRVDQGESLLEALYQTLSDSFYDGDAFDAEKLAEALAILKNL